MLYLQIWVPKSINGGHGKIAHVMLHKVFRHRQLSHRARTAVVETTATKLVHDTLCVLAKNLPDHIVIQRAIERYRRLEAGGYIECDKYNGQVNLNIKVDLLLL